jgi:TIR domain
VHDRLKLWLSEEINRDAELFIDEDNIETGDRWPEKLREALKGSRCMVCLWSPSYFRSNWCVSEWKSFLEREKRLKLISHGLILPLRFHDGEHFPEEARAIQWTDVAPYASTLPAFWASLRALELEDRLKEFVVAVAKILTKAPPFERDWPIVEARALPAAKIALAQL